MKCDSVTRALVIAAGMAAIAAGQTRVDLRSQSQNIDFSNAQTVKPLPIGENLPATCSLGQMFFKEDTVAGQNLYICPAPNLWTQISGTAATIPLTMQAGTTGGILVLNTEGTFNVDADTMFVAAQAGNNLFTGHNDFSGAASLRITTGSLEPPAAGCDTSSETGSIYMLTGNSTKANLLYICQTTADGYGWRPATYGQGASAPTTCIIGEIFFDTDATAGENWLGCTAANTWTMLGGGGAGPAYGMGTTPPATCTIGEAFFDTDATAGENWLGCTAANTWTMLGGGGAGPAYGMGTTPPATCTIGEAFFDTDATAGENWLGCTAANTWTVLGKRHERGVTAPVTCSVGDVFFDTDATAGQNWQGCTAANTWTMLGGGAGPAYGMGTTPPATCTIGEAFFDTDATAGENWLGCTTTNSWTVLGKRHERGITAPVTCTVGDVFFDTDATAGQNWLGCTAANTWTMLGTTSAGSSRLLSWQKQASATTLNGSEAVIASTIVPGQTIPSGACLKFRAGFQHTTGTAAVEYRIRYGGSYLTALAPTTNTQIVRLEGFMCNDPGSTGAQQIAAGYMLSTTNSAEQMTTMAVDSTANQMFSLAAVGPATDAITLRYFLVEVLK